MDMYGTKALKEMGYDVTTIGMKAFAKSINMLDATGKVTEVGAPFVVIK